MDKNKEKLLIKVAYLYYIEEKKQSQISKELNINQATVSRLLHEAKEQEIVKIEIRNDEYTNLIKLERYIQDKYGLKNVIITNHSKKLSETEKCKSVAKEAAIHLRQIIQNDSVVGLASGKTIEYMIESTTVNRSTDAIFVPLVGAPGHSSTRYHVNAVVYEIAKQYDGKSIFINATAVQEDKETRNNIVNAKYFEEIKAYWAKLDIALIGVGEPYKQPLKYWYEQLTPADMEEMKLYDAAAESCCTFIDRDGKIIKNEQYERKIGIDLSTLKDVPHSIVVVQSKKKAAPLTAILKSGFINTLVTDKETILEVLKRSKDQNYQQFQ